MNQLVPPATPTETAGVPRAVDGPETTVGELTGASFDREAIDRNYFWMRERRTTETQKSMLDDVSNLVFGDPAAWRDFRQDEEEYDPRKTLRKVIDDPTGETSRAAVREEKLADMFDRLDILREFDPGTYANVPGSVAELKDLAENRTRTDLQVESDEIDRKIANRSDPTVAGGVASFVGASGAAITDAEGLATLPFGAAGRVTLARRALIEGALGGGTETLTLPAYRNQAKFLGREAPDALKQILFGTTFGTLLPLAGRGLKVGANSLTPSGRVRNRDLIGFGRRAEATPRERGAANAIGREIAAEETAPAGVVPDEHVARIDDAEAQLDAGKIPPVRVPDEVPVTYATAGKIRNKPVSDDFLSRLRVAVAPLGDDIGVMITSGGQDRIGTPGARRIGSTRHDVDDTGHSHTGDLVLTRNGKPVKPGQDRELYQRFFFNAAAQFPGIGHYEWGVHVGSGAVAAWGPTTHAASLDPAFGDAIKAGREGFTGWAPRANSGVAGSPGTAASTNGQAVSVSDGAGVPGASFDAPEITFGGGADASRPRVKELLGRYEAAEARRKDLGSGSVAEARAVAAELDSVLKELKAIEGLPPGSVLKGLDNNRAAQLADIPQSGSLVKLIEDGVSVAEILKSDDFKRYSDFYLGGGKQRFFNEDAQALRDAITSPGVVRNEGEGWVAIDRKTGEIALVTQRREVARKVNPHKYIVLPDAEHLALRNAAIKAGRMRDGPNGKVAIVTPDEAIGAARRISAAAGKKGEPALRQNVGEVKEALEAVARDLQSDPELKDAVQTVIDAITGADRPHRAGAAKAGPDGNGGKAADGQLNFDAEPEEPVGSALRDLDLFEDPVEGRGTLMQVDGIERDLRRQIADNPKADIEIPLETGDGAARARVSEILNDIDDEQNFFEEFELCMPKGATNG